MMAGMTSPDITPAPRLLADIGGTNARFAWQAASGAPLQVQRTYACADFPTLQDAAQRYLADCGLAAPTLGAIGIANPVDGDAVRMTNHHWSFSIEALRRSLSLQRLVVVNDFKALALSLPHLPNDALLRLGGDAPDPLGSKGLIGPGTGLGVGGLVRAGAGWVALDSEGGHTSVSPATAREWAVVQAQYALHGHCSFERLVSGMGLQNLHASLRELDGLQAEAGISAADVTERGLKGGDAHAAEALQMFLALLGSAAGNLALTLGARGGVYLGGGILPRLKPLLASSALRSRFEAKGRFAPWLQRVPLLLIDGTELPPALLGAAAALDAVTGGP
ncbi:glucokinase [Burkholderiales bacterium JOSHI_001]|nr:glucokinase [Burkholderiales bacterium JOSHI_001]